MPQLSSTDNGSTPIQPAHVGARLPNNKLPTSTVPSMWRMVVLPNRLTTASNESDSALRLRFDSAHGVAPRQRELIWTAQIGLLPALDMPFNAHIDCCATLPIPTPAPIPAVSTAPTAGPTVATGSGLLSEPMSSRSIESQQFGERYRAMLAEAAHDIRAPLGVARQILARIASRVREDGALTNQDKRLLDNAHDRLQQATLWVDGILLPNRLKETQTGTMRQRFYPHQLRGIVEPIVSVLARDRDVELDWIGWDRSLPRLYLDANQLGRVLLNLISNAIAASPRSSRLSLRIAWQTNVTQRLVIAVEDEGRGLAPALLRFVNSAQVTPAPIEAGIGLVTVKSLMNAIGGSISAQVGGLGGTLFRVTVPVDNRLSLVRGWLIQQSQRVDNTSQHLRDTVQLHVLRSSDVDTSLVDYWLQQAAAPQDFVYRVSEDRWLWLSVIDAATTAGALAAVKQCSAMVDEQHGQLHCHLAAEWINVELQSLHSATNQRNLLPQLAAAIADKFANLAGNRIPPINDLKYSLATKPKPVARHRDLIRKDEGGKHAPKIQLRPATPACLDLLTADPAIFAELAQDWREQHNLK